MMMGFLMKRFITLQLCFLAYLIVLALSESDSPIIGDTDDAPNFLVLTTEDPDGVYLNTDRPATCNGTISVVEFCYYGLPNLIQWTYRSLIAVYRPVDQNHYERVSETISITRTSYPFPLVPQDDNFQSGFSCESQTLTPSVEVQMGDIVGICIYNTRDTSELDMISFRPGGYRMMFEGAGSVGCDTGEMPQVLGDRLQLDSAPRTLHVSAQIIPFLAFDPSFVMSTTPKIVETPSNILSTADELGGTTITIVVATIAGFLSVTLVTLIIVITMIIACCFIARSRRTTRNHMSNRNVTYELNLNAAYHAQDDQGITEGGFGNNSYPTTLYDYVRNDSALSRPRLREQSPSTGEATSDSGFTIQRNVAYDH